MKIDSGTRQRREAEHLIPLINIVFLLLIFFMLMGSIKKSPETRVEVPTVSTTYPSLADGLVITLTQDGRVYLDGQVLELKVMIDAIRTRITGITGRQKYTANDQGRRSAAKPRSRSAAL